MKSTPLPIQPAPLAGVSLFLMTAWSIVGEIWPVIPPWPSGLFAWLAAIMLVAHLSRSQIIQIGALLLAGIAALFSGVALGSQPRWLRLLDSNSGLLSMLAAVSFLKLLALQDKGVTGDGARGMRGYWQTMAAVALFGAFINVSAPILVGDRISRDKRLDRFAAQSIIRAFSGGPTWSPFFAGMAVVLTYVEGADLVVMMAFGFPFALLGLLLVIAEAGFRYTGEVARFEGFPMTLASLWMPCVLVISVIVGRALLPDASILSAIALSALAVSAIGLVVLCGKRDAIDQLEQHILEGLPRMVSELVLFLAAGVLAVGLQTLVSATRLSLPLAGGFDVFAAALLLAALVFVSILGVHPLISITVLTPLFTPINPDPQLLAITFVFSWSLGVCASPLSGLNLIFQGRYGIPSLTLARLNWPYVVVMYGAAVLFIQGVAVFQGL